MFHCWTAALFDHFDHCFIVLKDVQLRLALRRICGCGDVVHMRQLVNISIFFFLGGLDFEFRELFPAAGLVDVLVLFDDCNTSITTSHNSRASNPFDVRGVNSASG